MSATLANWFVQKYDQSSVYHRAQQKDRRLMGTVTNAGSFVGDVVYLPRMGKIEMYDSPRMARIALANNDLDNISLMAKPKFMLQGVWDPDKNKLSVSMAEEMGKEQSNAYMRAEDAIIAATLASAAAIGVVTKEGATENIVTLGDYNTVANLDTLMAAISVLGENEKFEGEELTYVSPFKIRAQNALDPYVVKSDVKGNRPWDDINWRTYQGLPVTAGNAGVDTFLYTKSSIVYGFNDDFQAIRGRDDAALTDLIGGWFQAGAAARDAKGIIRIKSKYDFTLTRRPVDVYDHAVAP